MNILFSAQIYICTYISTLIVHYDNSGVLSCSVQCLGTVHDCTVGYFKGSIQCQPEGALYKMEVTTSAGHNSDP